MIPLFEVFHFGLTMPGAFDSIISLKGRKYAGGSED